MADLFTVTAPLVVRCPGNEARVMIAGFPHPEGLVGCEPFWHQAPVGSGVYLLSGKLRGEGPWKVGDCVITVLGCHGTDPALASRFAQWQDYINSGAPGYPGDEAMRERARQLGAPI